MTDTQNNFTATEIKAGIMVLSSLVILVLFLAAIRGCRPSDESAKTFTTSFTDISGLNYGADVRFGGVKVGRVAGIEPDAENRSLIIVSAEVGGNIPVNEGSTASIEQVSLTAEMHLEISTGNKDSALLESGATIPSRSSGGGLIELPDLEGVVSRLETAIDGIITLVGVQQSGSESSGNDGEVVSLVDLLESVEKTMENSGAAVNGLSGLIEENRAGIRDVVDRFIQLEKTTTDLINELRGVVSENREPLKQSFKNLEQLTSETNKQIEELVESLQSTATYLEHVGGNSSDLLEHQRPTIEEILRNLQETTRNLKEFSRVLADQPEALIRGRGKQGRKSEGAR